MYYECLAYYTPGFHIFTIENSISLLKDQVFGYLMALFMLFRNILQGQHNKLLSLGKITPNIYILMKTKLKKNLMFLKLKKNKYKSTYKMIIDCKIAVYNAILKVFIIVKNLGAIFILIKLCTDL